MSMMNILEQDVKYLKGVGPVRASLLASELDIHTIEDLLTHLPYKYVDRSVVHIIRNLQDDMPYVQLRGRILNVEIDEGRKRKLRATFTDGTGYVELIWFNCIKTIERTLRVDKSYLILGKPSSYNGRFSIIHPEMEDAEQKEKDEQGRSLTLVAHYHTTERMKRVGMGSRQIAGLIKNAFVAVASGINETLPPQIVSAHKLQDFSSALYAVHFPSSSDQLPEARRRLKFEELFYLQLHILRYTLSRKRNVAGILMPKVGKPFRIFYEEHLPFALTDAQKRVIKEIRADLTSGRQMNRLLQGDVGSGKTVVALMVCLLAIGNGFQACLMAPTEILAEQHLVTLRKMLEGMPICVELLTANVKGATRGDILERTRLGEVHILVGTHALIEPNVEFFNLGIAVIDEQHRFGVKQRARIWEKNLRPPHILVMTATPIPRTLAMTVYGDLDVSVINELPPGRKPIQTLHYSSSDLGKLYSGMRRELVAGHQIYVVYPLIEENEKMALQDLENGYEGLCSIFPDFVIGRVHGRMKPDEKDKVMKAFSCGNINILLSTTVIEVGVNVPNATVMVVQNAERFGLSQLHQLRGRVGRGAERSYCILVTASQTNETTRRRMNIMVDTNNGFIIAEEDLKLRGPGDLQGTAQSGLPFNLKIAGITQDAELMAEARKAAGELLQQDPQQNLPQNAIVWRELRKRRQTTTDFSAIS